MVDLDNKVVEVRLPRVWLPAVLAALSAAAVAAAVGAIGRDFDSDLVWLVSISALVTVAIFWRIPGVRRTPVTFQRAIL